MEKILFNSLEKETYDSLLIDFIDWRFGIDQIKNEPRLTLSAKLFKENQIALEFIKLGTPTQNSFIERFNRTYREAVLNIYAFKTLNEVRELTDSWIREYNEERTHDSPRDLTPWKYLAKPQPPETSNLNCH